MNMMKCTADESSRSGDGALGQIIKVTLLENPYS